MIGRVDGQVVLVAGAIPGERVTARIERVGKGIVFAETVTVDESSPDRLEPFTDPLCGGCLYAHIAYPRQLDIKAQVIADAFARIAHLPIPASLHVAPSPAEGYRMRARLHLRHLRWGFFREGSHQLCDARATRQLLPATCDAIDRLAAGLRSLAIDEAHEVEVAENIDASERVVHITTSTPIDVRRLLPLGQGPGMTGLTATASAGERPPHLAGSGRTAVVAGNPYVADVLVVEDCSFMLRRHVLAFFQGNRYLLRDLVSQVTARIVPGSDIIDLYAGAGLFSVAAAVLRRARVTAVEGNPAASRDLLANAAQAQGAVTVAHQPVEAFVSSAARSVDAVIVDPPRTGMSREALEGVIGLRATRVVYVSCDVATLARDGRRLVDGGYTLHDVAAFDLFPNTPHVETVAVFMLP